MDSTIRCTQKKSQRADMIIDRPTHNNKPNPKVMTPLAWIVMGDFFKQNKKRCNEPCVDHVNPCLQLKLLTIN